MEPSDWVRKMVKGFGKYVGFSISSSVSQCTTFFQQIERAWEEQDVVASPHRVRNSNQKGMRELRNLISTISHDGQPSRNNRGNLKSIGMGFGHCS